MTSTIISSLVSYMIASIFLAAAPGPDMLLVLRFALKEGIRPALGVVLGIVTSLFLWGIATILGLSALLFTFKEAFFILKWAGSAYLIYLAVRLMLTKTQNVMSAISSFDQDMFCPLSKASFFKAYRQGLVTNLLNPMIGVLFLVIFPGFIPAGADIKTFTLILTVIQMLVAFVTFTSLTLLSQSVAAWLREGKGPVWIDRIAGLALLFFAIKLFFAHSPV